MKLEIRSECEEKLFHCGSYQELVSRLAEAMVIVPERVFLEEGESFDCERLECWIQAVEYKQGKVPKIEVVLPMSSQKELRFEVRRLESDLRRGCEPDWAGRLLVLAKIEAKIEVVEGVAEEVYPAMIGEIGEWRRQLKEEREEILGGERDEPGWEAVLEKMGTKRWMADIY